MGRSEGKKSASASSVPHDAVTPDTGSDEGDADEDGTGEEATEEARPRDGLAYWTGVNPRANEVENNRESGHGSASSTTVSRPSLGEWMEEDDPALGVDTERHRSETEDDMRETASGFGFNYIEAPAAKWTFDPDSIRRYVESRLEGRVLNLFAGQTHLRHADEVVRNDLNESIEADHHFNAIDVADQFPPRSFDTIVLDPPYNVRKAREKYSGRYRGEFTVIKDRVVPLVKLGGRVIHFGYASTGMSRSRGFEKREVCLINHKGDHNDTICVVEDRVEGGLDSYADSAEPTTLDRDGTDTAATVIADGTGPAPTNGESGDGQ